MISLPLVVCSQYWELSTSVLLQIISHLLNLGLQKTAQGSMTEKVKNRLEQLDDFEEVTTPKIILGILKKLKIVFSLGMILYYLCLH